MKRFTLAASLCAGLSVGVNGQEAGVPASIEISPTALTLEIGNRATLDAVVRDADGAVVDAEVVYFSRARRSVGVNPIGQVEAYLPGEFTIVALVPRDPEDQPRRAEALVEAEVTVTVPEPPILAVAFQRLPTRFYAGTTLPLEVRVVDTAQRVRDNVAVRYASSDEAVASVDRFGQLTLHAPGSVEITATAESVSSTLTVRAEDNPVATLELTASTDRAATGDVVRFTTIARDEAGDEVSQLPVQYAVQGETASGIIAAGAPAHVAADGRFVAERSGRYTVLAVAGSHTARATIEIEPRDVQRRVEVVGHGPVRDRHTSDLWVWEGIDGRDYAITGTWGADGHAYIWDVTDPSHMSIIDVVRVDARTVNDVKVSEDGRVAVISREGASNRRNGLVLLDVSDPANGVSVLSRYDDQLTGGVHNVFIYESHVYALSAGRRFDILNIEDPSSPTRVGRFELDTPGHGIHDVWVEDGIAYSSNWADGVVAIDVGGGDRGGSVQRPVMLGSAVHPSGWNHAAFPYRSQSTGTFYVFAGDEAFPYGDERWMDGQPERAAGWIHVYAWDEWNDPQEVARYQVPEAGTHNLWIEDDILYIAYYNGGLRIVDVSGELMGDLYRQGREIAFWEAHDPEGYIKNAPMAWGPQPYKGHVFVADHNSGLWAIKLEPKTEGPIRDMGEPR